MRNLASVQKILALTPIEGADAIECATVLGWQVVVKKGEFSVGDVVVYVEIDSVLPEREEFEFMRPRKFRVKTIRLRGQISQGIVFPISILPDGTYEEEQEVTEILGIVKYEIPESNHHSNNSKPKGNFPSFIPKTDETRVQNLQKVLTRYKGTPCYITEKLDGSSMTCYLKDGVFGVCSRNLDLLDVEGNRFWEAAKSHDIEAKLRAMFAKTGIEYAVQGELIGEGIQGNKYKLKGTQFRIFNIFDIERFAYVGLREFLSFWDYFKFKAVPLIKGEYELSDSIPDIVQMSVRKSLINPDVWAEGHDVWAEGIVVRPTVEKVDLEMSRGLSNGRLSFKAINPEFLLKYGE